MLELGLAVADAAGVPPAMAGWEMLNDGPGHARTTAGARTYAREQNIPFVTGRALAEVLG